MSFKGCYEQLYTLERAAASPSPGTKNSLKHQGFIFIFFRLLGENCASSNADLESRWLDWTGAGQIYKVCLFDFELEIEIFEKPGPVPGLCF